MDTKFTITLNQHERYALRVLMEKVRGDIEEECEREGLDPEGGVMEFCGQDADVCLLAYRIARLLESEL